MAILKMIATCIQSVYLSVFIWALMSKILFFIALRNSKGEIETMIQIAVLFDIIMLLTLPLLLMMTKGMC